MNIYGIIILITLLFSYILNLITNLMNLRHLKPDGVIVAHVSSQYVDLIPVVMALARHQQLVDILIRNGDDDPPLVAGADWMLLTRSQEFLQQDLIREVGQVTAETDELPLWTDQYNNLFRVLRRVD